MKSQPEIAHALPLGPWQLTKKVGPGRTLSEVRVEFCTNYLAGATYDARVISSGWSPLLPHLRLSQLPPGASASATKSAHFAIEYMHRSGALTISMLHWKNSCVTNVIDKALYFTCCPTDFHSVHRDTLPSSTRIRSMINS